MGLLVTAVSVAGVVAFGVVWVQFLVAARKYGVLSALLGELLLGGAIVWYIDGWIRGIAASPDTLGPVGFGAILLGGHVMLSVAVIIVINAISGVVVWRLTREWR